MNKIERSFLKLVTTALRLAIAGTEIDKISVVVEGNPMVTGWPQAAATAAGAGNTANANNSNSKINMSSALPNSNNTNTNAMSNIPAAMFAGVTMNVNPAANSNASYVRVLS